MKAENYICMWCKRRYPADKRKPDVCKCGMRDLIVPIDKVVSVSRFSQYLG